MAELVNAPDEGNPSEIDKPEAPNIPEQFQGKSPEELVSMYRSLERKLGEQSEELGSLRALAEQSISEAGSSNESTDVDFFDNPEQAIERIIERKLAPFSASIQAQQEASVKEKLSQAYPGWEKTAKSEAFEKWVAGSKVRTELYVRANSADYDAAAELFESWGAVNQPTEKIAEQAVGRDRKLRAAKTERGAAGIDPRKILNRSDLRTLRQNNPTRYNELLPDIRQAYADGRVR